MSETSALIETRLRVATWNLWWRFGPWEQRQPGILQTMRDVDADVWCLQEVWETRDGESQPRTLAEALGGYDVAHVAGVGLDLAPESMGNAILSRWPIVDSERRSLPSLPYLDELRTAVRADIAGPRGDLQVFCTHLNWRLDQSHVRQLQARAVCEFIDETRGRRTYPPILCGDLNADPVSEEIRKLKGQAEPYVPKLIFLDAWDAGGCGVGHSWDNTNEFAVLDCEPNRRIDYVLVGYPREHGAGQCVRAELVGTERINGVYPSDHFGVRAELRY